MSRVPAAENDLVIPWLLHVFYGGCPMKNRCEFQWFGQKWVCVRGKLDDSDDGGECDNPARRIIIDIKQDEDDFLTILHHELTEGASYIVGCTHTRNYPESRDLYVMTHNEMNLVSISVRGAYEDIKAKMLEDPPGGGQKEKSHDKPDPASREKGTEENRKRP